MFLRVLTRKVIEIRDELLFSRFPCMLWFCSRPTKWVLYAHWIDTRHTLLYMLVFTSLVCLKRQSQWKKGHPLFSFLGRKWHSTTKKSLLTLGVCFWIQRDSVKFCQCSQLPDGTRMQTEDWSLMNPARARISITVRNKNSGQLRAWIVPKSGPGTFLAWVAWSLALWSKSALELAKDLHSTVEIPIWAGIRNEFPWIIFTETTAD